MKNLKKLNCNYLKSIRGAIKTFSKRLDPEDLLMHVLMACVFVIISGMVINALLYKLIRK